jgi:hypothetical protein
MEKESLQRLLHQGLSVERIAKRFAKDPSTVSYWMAKHGLESPYKQRHAAKGGIERQRLEQLVEAGCTIADIAEEVGRSKGRSGTGCAYTACAPRTVVADEAAPGDARRKTRGCSPRSSCAVATATRSTSLRVVARMAASAAARSGSPVAGGE